MQAIRATRPGGHVGYVGVAHDVAVARLRTVLLPRSPARRPRTGPPLPARPDPAHLGPQDRPRQGLRPQPPPRPGRRGLPGDGRTPRHQGPSDGLIAPNVPAKRGPMKTISSTAVVMATSIVVLVLAACEPDATTGNSVRPTTPVSSAPGDPVTGSPSGVQQSSRPRSQHPPATEEDAMRIHITIGEQHFQATLDGSAAARDLAAQLPLAVDMSDHGGVEKTGPLPAPLSLDGQPARRGPRRRRRRLLRPATIWCSITATSPTTTASSFWADCTMTPPNASRPCTAPSKSSSATEQHRAT